MTNREKYAEEILDLVLNGENIAVKDGKPVFCADIKCMECAFSTKGSCKHALSEWAKQEYVPCVDWEKVKVDTPILVRDSKDRNWTPRHFAEYIDKTVYAWACGDTSWSTCDRTNKTAWNYAKLPEGDEEIL